MCASFLYEDNTFYGANGTNDPTVGDFLETPLAHRLLDRSLKALVEEDSLLVLPPTLKEAEDLEDDQMVLTGEDGGFRTTNLMGFLACDGDSLSIRSRFSGNMSSDGNDYLLIYMLRRVMHLNVVDSALSLDGREGYRHLLPFAFPGYLVRAVRRGVLRAYVRQEHDDAHVRGTIDVPRYMVRDVPFSGSVAYSTRELTADNHVTELVRHVIEYMGASPSLGRLLSADREVRDAVALVRQLTPSYSRGDRARVVGRNRRLPVRSRFYSDYLALQRLCVAILSDGRILLQGDAGRMRGILFDGAWLWEEYVATLLGDEFFHPRNRAREGGQQLFDKGRGLIYPDFVSRDAGARVVADAKYKPTDNVHGADYLQILAYMLRFDARLGLFLHPSSAGDVKDDVDMHVLRGAHIPVGHGCPDEKARRRGEEDGILVRKVGLGIPSDCLTYEEFCKQMTICEESFLDAVRIP